MIELFLRKLPLPGLGLIGLVAAAIGARAAEAPVTARLSIPAAETHVIGDPVTLTWHFTNPTARPMAFVWEACCRLNGRLIVSQNGVDLPPIPPGPAAAHAFAKPAIILPGRENAFESMLADWVLLKRTGKYELRGRYVGVLPEQKPPYPPTVSLWRGEADTAPIAVELVSVADYLAQRPERARRRGLDATVEGPDRLSAGAAATYQLRIRNTGTAPLTLQWPLDADLWLVDDAGLRLYRSPTKPAGPERSDTLPPGGESRMEFPVTVADLNGAPFGRYQVFIDFPGRDGLPRVPSSAQAFDWSLSPGDVTALLNEAAASGKAAARNAPLLLLRRYLPALEAQLTGPPDPSLSEPAQALRRQLAVAACVRDFPVVAGRAHLPLEISEEGTWRLGTAFPARCVPGAPGEQLAQILSARRHLGWEVAADLRPAAGTTVNALFTVVAALAPHHSDFAVPPRSMASAPPGSVPGSVTFSPTAPPANLVLRIAREGTDAARTLPKSGEPVGLTDPAQFSALPFSPLSAVSDLEKLLTDGKLSSPQVVVLSAGDLRWDHVEPWLRPFLRRGWQIDLTQASAASGTRTP